MSSRKFVQISGSERAPLPGATQIGAADPNEAMQVTLVLRPRTSTPAKNSLDDVVVSGERVSRDEYAARYGADPADVQKVRAFAEQSGLTVSNVNLFARTVILSGTCAVMSQAFQVQLATYKHAGGTYRGRTGAVSVPEELSGIVQAVHGLDNRPQAKTHFRIASTKPGSTKAAAAAAVSYTALQVAQAYSFPNGVNGSGQTIGIIELGGGYNQSDLDNYFSGLNISPAPTVIAVSVDGAQNQPTGDTDGPDTEVGLDIEVAGAIASGATIVVYFAPNTDAGFLDAITTAAHDTANKPSIISISWGGPESNWTPQAMTAFDSAFQAAAAMGITVCVASGDNGSGDGVNDGADHVDFPASSPNVLACGGTRVQGSGTTITGESVWNDGAQGGAGGGGVSGFFARPAWQNGLNVTLTSGGSEPLAMRGVPDVSGDADPESGYDVRIDGTDTVIGGTSAVAPLWAGLLARINSSRGNPVGYINPQLYAASAGFHDITTGNNGTYAAASKWDACTGLGSPDGKKIAALFQQTSTGKSAAA